MSTNPIRIAVVNDYELVVAGVYQILKPYADRIEVVELNVNTDVAQPVDIALFDSFGAFTTLESSVQELSTAWLPQRVVLYTWELSPKVEGAARLAGIDGVVSKGLGAADLVDALEAVSKGNGFVVRDQPNGPEDEQPNEPVQQHEWPGRSAGLSMREAEMVSLICQGLSNAQIAERAYLSPNSVKSYIRSAYRKMGVQTRAQAVAWGIQNGLLPEVGRKAV